MKSLGKMWTLIAILALSSTASQENNNDTAAMIVEFDIFSGKPNPTWHLSAEQAKELLGALHGLPPADEPVPESGLGYRGFFLSNPSSAEEGTSRIRIYAGIVTMTKGDVRFYRDIHGIERQLLRQASQHGHKTIADSLLEGMFNP